MKREELSETEAKIYHKIKLRITFAEIAINLAILGMLSFTPLSSAIAAKIEFFISNSYLQFLAFSAAVGSIFFVISTPIDFYGSYVIEHQFNLSNQSIRRWLFENFKSFILSLVIALPLLLAFFFLLKSTGSNWWIFFSLVIFTFSFIIAKMAPILIFPLFYKFAEIEENDVKEKISALLAKQKLSVKGIYSFDMSKNTKKANAAFAGIGNSRRILLSDTLIQNFTSDEIEVIFTHELGHYTHNHIIKNMVINFAVIFATFFLCAHFYDLIISYYNYKIYDLEALPILFLLLTVFSLIAMPLNNFVSRLFEVEADRFAIVTSGKVEAFISGMEKLAKINLADKTPNPVIEFLFYSHPSLQKRINFAKELASRV